MPSFDIVSKTDMQEVDNAVNSVIREITNRYDFKDSKSSIERKDTEITILADDDYKLKAMQDMIKTHFVKGKIDPSALDFKKPETAAGTSMRQLVVVKQGIEQQLAKDIVKKVKDSKIKVQASIQGDEVRVTGKKRDELQEVIQMIREANFPLPLQFINFRD